MEQPQQQIFWTRAGPRFREIEVRFLLARRCHFAAKSRPYLLYETHGSKKLLEKFCNVLASFDEIGN